MNSNTVDPTFRGFVDRASNLRSEMNDLKADVRALNREVKENGYNVRLFNQVVREQNMDQNKLEDMIETLDQYRAKLGALTGTPLGNAAEANVARIRAQDA